MSDFILGVDLDGVCGDYTGEFRRVVAAERQIDQAELPEQISWDFAEWDMTVDEFLVLHRIGVEKYRMFRDMPAIDDVSDALWRLNDAGVWIRIITHRLVTHWGHQRIVSDTVSWLDSNRIPYRDLCFMGAKTEVQADAYIDDAPHNIEALRSSGNTVIVFDQPYNRDLGGLRAHNWAEVEAIVADLVVAKGLPFPQALPGFDAGSTRLDRHRERWNPETS